MSLPADTADHSRRVVITGRSVLTPLGDTPSDLHQALTAGRSAIAQAERFSELDQCDLKYRPIQAGALGGFDAGQYLQGTNLRPLDRASQLAAAAVALALEDANLSAEFRAENEVGLVLGTMYGGVHTISAFDRRAQTVGPKYASPLDFANTVINAAAGRAAILFDLRGMNSTMCTGSTSGLQAIGHAYELVRTGREPILLAGGFEEFCFESSYGFERSGRVLGPKSNGGSPGTFGSQRGGFLLAEGAALVVLESAESAEHRGAEVFAEVLGSGQAFEPSRGKDHQQATHGVEQAIRRALARSGIPAEQVDCLSASANGDLDNDRREAEALSRVFNGHTEGVAMTAIKAMLGESLGAAGALQVVSLVETLTRGQLPGVPNHPGRPSDFPLPNLSPETREDDYRVGMVTSLGLDGHSSALLLRRPDSCAAPSESRPAAT